MNSGRGKDRVIISHGIRSSSVGKPVGLWVQRGMGRDAKLLAVSGWKKGAWNMREEKILPRT